MRLEVLDNEEAAARVPHKLPGRAQTIIVAGKPEMGKTHFIRSYLSALEPRVLAFDPFNNFPWIRKASLALAFEDLEHEYVVRRRLVPRYGADLEEWAEEIFKKLVEDAVPDLLIELDEISLWIDHRKPFSGHAKELILQGRQVGTRIIAASQILAYIPSVLQSLATDLVVFQTTRPDDLIVLGKWSKELAARAPSLKEFQCFYLSL